MRTKTSSIGTLEKLTLAASILLLTPLTSLAQTNQHNPNATRGSAGVATQRAVANFAELARLVAAPVPAPPEAGAATHARLSPSNAGGLTPSPPPSANFVALEDDGFPDVPDTHGAVGPNHLMVALKSGYRIQDRSGQVISTVKSSNFWAAVGPFYSFTYDGKVLADIHDPRVLFDPYGQRFMLIEMANPQQVANACLLVGVSQTSDPTGGWNLYHIDADPANQLWIDHPNVGFNKDWIVVQALAGSASRIYVFNKTNLYNGGAGLFTLLTAPTSEQFLQPATTFDPSLPVVYLLGQTGTGTSLNSLRLYTITGQIGFEVLTPDPTITTTNRWDFTAPGGYFAALAPQLGATKRFGILGAGIHSLVYRNGSLWATHPIFVPAGGAATRSSVQWWQISPQGTVIQRGLIDDPSGVNFYGYPSLSVNQFNDVLIGYSRFSTNQYASANCAFRAGDDPANTLRADTVLKVGEAPYSVELGGSVIWGDYSATVVDPVNDTDLWTIQEYAAAPVGNEDRWGTWWGRISPIRVRAVEVVGGDALIRFTTAPDQSYLVERTERLASPILWETVPGPTNVAGTGNAVTVLDTGAASQPQRFYRVRLN